MKKCFCCELYAKALINALSHLLSFVLGKILICLLLCFYNSVPFLCAGSRQGWFCQGWWALSKTFCSQGLGGAEDEWKVQSLPQKSPSLTVSPQPLQFCHLRICVQHYTQNDVVIYNTWHDSRQTEVTPLCKRPTKLFTSRTGKLPQPNCYI